MGYSRPFQKIQVRDGSPKPLRTWLSTGSQTPLPHGALSDLSLHRGMAEAGGRFDSFASRRSPDRPGCPLPDCFWECLLLCTLYPRNHKDLELFLNEAGVKGRTLMPHELGLGRTLSLGAEYAYHHEPLQKCPSIYTLLTLFYEWKPQMLHSDGVSRPGNLDLSDFEISTLTTSNYLKDLEWWNLGIKEKQGVWFSVFRIKSYYVGLSCGSFSKESTSNAGHLGSIPGCGVSPGEGNGHPLWYSWCSVLRLKSSYGASFVAQLMKSPPAVRETWLDPWVGRIPWRRKWLPTPVFLVFSIKSKNLSWPMRKGQLSKSMVSTHQSGMAVTGSAVLVWLTVLVWLAKW